MSFPPESHEVTRLLEVLNGGEGDRELARQSLYERVYVELHSLAEMHRARWRGNDTLNTTAIVHEAFFKLVGGEGRYDGRAHFLAVASKAMRQVLYTYAERQAAAKRGGKEDPLSLNEEALVPPDKVEAFVALEDALLRLERMDERAARVVECRFFGGLSVEETAEALEVSPRTVARDWVTARTWLFGELKQDVGIAGAPKDPRPDSPMARKRPDSSG